MNGVDGATALRGVWGFHGDHAPHGERGLVTCETISRLDVAGRRAQARR